MRLLLSREQRKALDSFLDVHAGIASSVRLEVIRSMRDGVLPDRERFEKDAVADGVSALMASHLVTVAFEQASFDVTASNFSGKRRNARMLPVPSEEVVFSTSDKTVRVPGLGVCRYVANNKIVSEGCVVSFHRTPSKISVGYWNNDPCIELDTGCEASTKVDPDQKLVRMPAGRRSLKDPVTPSGTDGKP